ncbi:replication factor C large subunit [Hydra vulgaris]|uniref:Replication factor C subunit 1 n=1 Tax=Hydra vulgaris TaxID=6087 RepID=B6DQM4_HYDVU|nr:replication factor C large subunit [Hydra vulgaris]ACI04517.1 replication factor C large subunit [Hydra vulgaris]
MADIRSFFSSNKNKIQKKSSSNSVIDLANDSKNNSTAKEEKPNSNGMKKLGKKRKVLVIESDSDEEPLPSKFRKGKSLKESDTKKYTPEKPQINKEIKLKEVSVQFPPKENVQSSNTKKPKIQELLEKKELRPITAEDFFSGTLSVTSNKSLDDKKEKKNTPDVILPTPVKEPIKSQNKKNKLLTNIKEKDLDTNEREDTKQDVPEIKMKEAVSKYFTEAIKSDASNNKQKLNLDVSLKEKNKHKLKPDVISQSQYVMSSPKKTVKQKIEPDVTSPPNKIVEQKIEPYVASPSNKTVKQKIDSDVTSPPNKKVKAEKTETKPIETNTPVEKKKSYWAYKHRDGPSALGSKELPKGSDNCLAGLSFVITGVLEAFDRDEIADSIKRYGGKVTTSVSGKTSYIIVGRDPGETKIEKALKHKTKQIDEDGFIDLICSHSKKPNELNNNDHNENLKSREKSFSDSSKRTPILDVNSPTLKKKGVLETGKLDVLTSNSTSMVQNVQSPKDKPNLSQISPAISNTPQTQSPLYNSQDCTNGKTSSLLWVDKYKPATMRNIVGQQGDKSNANKLYKWLLKWNENNSSGEKKKNFYSGKEDGSIFKAALLSGPPGVGKTTTANLVCQELGFSFIEMNASDTRGKKALETIIKDALSNKTVAGVMQGNTGDKHALIMDEVDGMAGTEDRGGMQELIQLIKKTKIPIICMCNDRNHPKVRSLSNYCFDLRFYKPRVEQIKGFAMSVAAREGFKIQPQAMEQIVVGANQDIRQVLHNLQMWNSTKSVLNYDEAKSNANDASKNIKLGPFDIVKQLYTANDCSKMSYNEITDLFFMDYSFIPLFMQENYLYTNPAKARGNPRVTLDLISETADSFSDSDLVDVLIRGEQSWSLLPLQGLFSTVIPCVKMAGYIGQRIEFPRWLGKNSSMNKNHRILQELKMHMSLSAHCLKSEVNTDYIPVLKKRLTDPLLDSSLDSSAAAKLVISTLNDYNLLREDWDSILEISKWGEEPDIASKIPSKVKSAFTRLYNKETHKIPYTLHQAPKKIKGASQENVLEDDDEDIENEDIENEEEDSEDIKKDAMILIKKEPVSKVSGKEKRAAVTSTDSKKKPSSKKSASSSKKGKLKK